MKRSNHKNKKGQKPVITCAHCGHESPSKFAAKQHSCRYEEEARRYA